MVPSTPQEIMKLAAKAIPDKMNNVRDLDVSGMVAVAKITFKDAKGPIVKELNVTINNGSMTINYNQVNIDRSTTQEKFSFDDRQKVLPLDGDPEPVGE